MIIRLASRSWEGESAKCHLLKSPCHVIYNIDSIYGGEWMFYIAWPNPHWGWNLGQLLWHYKRVTKPRVHPHTLQLMRLPRCLSEIENTSILSCQKILKNTRPKFNKTTKNTLPQYEVNQVRKILTTRPTMTMMTSQGLPGGVLIKELPPLVVIRLLHLVITRVIILVTSMLMLMTMMTTITTTMTTKRRRWRRWKIRW